MSSLAVGIDMVEIDRVRHVLRRFPQRFLERVYTPVEAAVCHGRTHELAARFAAKEAAMKALGTGWTRGVAFLDLEVRSDGIGPPTLEIRGRAAAILAEQGFRGLRLSLTHTATTAGAVVAAIGP